jgi:long-chain acyl-CoA synthetase
MDRFWLKSYPPEVPSDIDPSVYPSVVALLEESFDKFRQQRAYVCMDKAITFGDIHALSTSCPRPMSARSCGANCATAC